VKGSCEHGNEASAFIKCWEFLDWLSDWRRRKQLVPWSYAGIPITRFAMHCDSFRAALGLKLFQNFISLNLKHSITA
jgi:hypothetical protein